MTKGDRDKLRAELAGKAMQGLLSNPNVVGESHRTGWGLVNCEMKDVVSLSAEWADALMAELGIKGEG